MELWLQQAAEGLKVWAPLLSEAHALEIARDLYVAWPDDAPTVALRKFLREVPDSWQSEKMLVA